MSLQLTQVPQDVLLELAKELDVADLFSFLSTCHVIRELRSHRTLWLDALVQIRDVQRQPLPYSPEAINSSSLLELESIARRANRLINNFKTDNPHPVRLQNLSIGLNEIILCVPGTTLCISHFTGTVNCWDIVTSQCVAQLRVPELQVQTGPCMEIPGKVLIGASIGPWRNPRNLVAISIDFHDRARISFSQVISPTMNNTPHDGTRPFIDARVLGFCTSSTMISWRMDANAVVETKTHNIPIRKPLGASCLSVEDSLYIFPRISFASDAAIAALPLPSTSGKPHAVHLALNTTTQTIPFPAGYSPTELQGQGFPLYSPGSPHLFPPHYGIFAVTPRMMTLTPHQGQQRHISFIHFWPARVTDHGHLEFGESCFYQHTHRIVAIAVGISGRYVLFWVKDEESYLGLVHFSATAPLETSFRKLDIGDVSLVSCRHIAFDDSLGLVFVTDTTGMVKVISYA
ncbi:hypothetical protein B0H17DRAFT_1135527 [Mycena rosella]|uniref:F-box domain-containing protein n=1 Tax=Mycena rosella TaxID=1033263 RepID=A0AAD7DD69_MYCRO|nr:hypothetical protein B0H17DRAFT_1135527 [Mycena rosella]